MGFDGLLESSSAIEALKTLISSYDKKCSTIYALADQITGIDRCEKDLFKLPEDTFSRLENIIAAKMMDELNNLCLIIEDMEEQTSRMESIVSRMESICQSSLERGTHDAQEFQQLQTIYSASNCMTAVVDAKRHHLETMNCYSVKSILEARKDTRCKAIDKELDRYVIVSKKK